MRIREKDELRTVSMDNVGSTRSLSPNPMAEAKIG